MKKKVAVIGTNGIPAKYGGFETLAEFLTKYLQNDFDFFVYCSKPNRKDNTMAQYNGAQLIYIPLKANGYQSVIYDIISTIDAIIKYDVLIVLGPAAGYFLFINMIFRKKIIVNHGGLDEWDREKYSKFQKLIIKVNHYIAGKIASYNIADNDPLKVSLKSTFNIDAVVIEYGGDHVRRQSITNLLKEKYLFLNKEYYLSVSRAQVDNNLHLLLEAFESMPDNNLVIISNWNISEYGKKLKQKYKSVPNLYMVDAVYEKNELDVIRSNALIYIHSHSRCGTAPSLVEAMSYDIPVICFDVLTNRKTTMNKSIYFNSSEELKYIIKNINSSNLLGLKNDMYSIAKEKYTWDVISNKYKTLISDNL